MLILWVRGWEPLPGRERGTQGRGERGRVKEKRMKRYVRGTERERWIADNDIFKI